MLLEKDANVKTEGGDSGGRTALRAASNSRYENFVQLLLEKGADVNTTAGDSGGTTALQAASGGRYENIVELLLEMGAEQTLKLVNLMA